MTCATDKIGNVFLAGYTSSTGTLIATAGSHQTTIGGGFTDAYVAKLNSNGVRQWATYYGGSGDDRANTCFVDNSFNIYLAGASGSNNGTTIATVGSHQQTYGGGLGDAFIAKFDSSGVRIWGTYYGGSGSDQISSGAADPSGNVYFAGRTDSNTGTVIATPGSHQSSPGGSSDGFLVKFNTSGIRLWGTYYGGAGGDDGTAIAIDSQGNIFIGGLTTSTVLNEIATAGSHQMSFGGGSQDAYLAKFNSSGVRQWGTYYGGTVFDQATAISIDKTGNVFLAGYTTSSGGTSIATPSGHQSNYNGPNDGFLAKFDNNGMRQWGTYYGDTGDETARACHNDSLGNIYLAGYTNSTGTLIATPGAHQQTYGGAQYDGFLIKFNPSGLRLWGTYYGGGGYDRIWGMTVNKNNEIYCSGHSVTSSGTTIATSGSHQNTNSGSADAFLVKFCDIPEPPTNNTPPGNQTLCANSSATLLASGSGLIQWFATPTATNVLGTGTAFITPTLGVGTYTYYAESLSCLTSTVRTPVTLTVSICTGFDNLLLNWKDIYPSPNPTSGELVFNFTGSQPLKIEIYDVLGKNLMSEHNYTAGRTLRIVDFDNGIYFLRVVFNGQSNTYKIIKD